MLHLISTVFLYTFILGKPGIRGQGISSAKERSMRYHHLLVAQSFNSTGEESTGESWHEALLLESFPGIAKPLVPSPVLHTPVVQPLRRWWQKDQKFKDISYSVVSFRHAWASCMRPCF